LEAKELREKLLNLRNKDFTDYIINNFSNEKVDYENLRKRLNALKELELDELEFILARVKSLEELNDPSKSISIIIGLVILILGLYVNFVKNFTQNPIIEFILGICLYGGIFLFISKELTNQRLRKGALIFFGELIKKLIEKSDSQNM
jgi:hypothetical protein